MSLTKSQIATEIGGALEEDGITIPTRTIKNVLDGLAQVAEEQVAGGNDFVVPGVARLTFSYRAPQKKGAKYKKGETYVGFGGVEQTAEEDSKPVTERITLKAAPTGAVAKTKPGTKPEAQKEFIKSKAGKNVKSRKVSK